MISNAEKQRISGCEGKAKFTTFARAKRTASAQAHKHGERFSPYACPHCGSYHVGSSVAGGTPPTRGFNQRQRYQVFARKSDGIEQSVGYDNHADGSALSRFLGPEWMITRVVAKRT